MSDRRTKPTRNSSPGTWIARVAILAVLVLVAAACSSGGDADAELGAGTEPQADTADDPGTPIVGGSLRYALDGETNTYDAANGQWSVSSWAVASAIFDPLMYYSDAGELEPFLAESVTPNDDYTEWTITLREGVEFQNGEIFDADAFLQNYEAQKASPLLGAVLGPIIETEKVDDLNVKLTMAAPWVHYPQILADTPGIMMAPEMIADPDGGRNPIGTGPFSFEEWVIDSYLRVVRNDNYWLAPPLLNEIEFRVIPDATSRMNSLNSGAVDITILGTAPEIYKDLAEDPGDLQLLTNEKGEDREVFLMMNQLRAPFDDLEIRRALVMATNRDLIAEVIGGGLYEPAAGIYDPGSPWYVETDYPDYDPDAAREIIAAWEAENGDLAITLTGPPWDIVLRGGQLLQEEWEQVGIDVTLETTELTQFVLQTVTADYDVAVWQFHGASHPDGEFVFLHSQYAAPAGELGLNFTRNVNYAIDDALLEARATDDIERLRELYGIVQKEMAKDLPYIFLWHNRDALVARENVRDITDWELPSGSPGGQLLNARHRFHQIWLGDQ